MTDEPLYYAKGNEVWKRPIETPREGGGKTISIGFKVCTCTDVVGLKGAETVAKMLSLAEGHPDAYRHGWEDREADLIDGAKRVLSAPSSPGDGWETGWLIENYGSKHNIYRAEWLTADIYAHTDDRDHWTKDASKALRFSRKADADAVIAALGWTEAKATEHQWSAAPSSPGDGWVMVPIVPRDEMVRAGDAVLAQSTWPDADDIWTAMIDARPLPTEGEG